MISTETRRSPHTGNGSASSYDYDFLINSQDDLVVKVVDNLSSPTEYSLVRGVDYNVSGVGNPSGGSISLIDAGQAWINGSGNLVDGYYITIISDADYLQDTDLANQTSNFQETQEDTFDKSVILIQQLREIILRSPKFSQSVNVANFAMDLPLRLVGLANRSLVTNTTGDGWAVGPTVADIEDAATNAAAAAASAAQAAASEAAVLAAEQARWSDWTNEQTITAGAGATALAGQTWVSADQQAVLYEFMCYRGTTIFATGRVDFHKRDGTWVVAPGMIQGNDPDLTWSLTGTTTKQLNVAAGSGDNAVIRLSRRFINDPS